MRDVATHIDPRFSDPGAWDRGVDVVVEGDAVQVTDEATLHRLAGEWRKK